MFMRFTAPADTASVSIRDEHFVADKNGEIEGYFNAEEQRVLGILGFTRSPTQPQAKDAPPVVTDRAKLSRGELVALIAKLAPGMAIDPETPVDGLLRTVQDLQDVAPSFVEPAAAPSHNAAQGAPVVPPGFQPTPGHDSQSATFTSAVVSAMANPK